MEGCSKYCSYCVVPYTRGEEVSRPFDDVLTEVAGLADQGVKEVTLLGQNVNAYRGAWATRGEIADFALLLEYVAEIPGIERIRYTTSHPNEFTQRLIDAYAPRAEAGEPPAPAGAARQRPHPDGDEARLHRDGIQEHDPQAARRAARHQPVVRLHRRLPRRDRRRLRATMKLIDDVGFDASFSFVFSARPGTPAANLPDDTPQERQAAAPAAAAGRDRGPTCPHQRVARGHGAAHPGRRPVAQGCRTS
jgi:tRNA-2-methylthio-N6-dimethylallyladenosine synthase